MSPRRMDISSLLREPSPPRDDDQHRTAPAPAPARPASVLSLLNNPADPHRPLARPPFLGLDALVHAANEERRRIDRDALRDAALDHHHVHPPHRRPPDSSPRSTPASSPTFPPVPSPSSRHQPSASPSNDYPTLRRQSVLHMDHPRPAIPVNDPRPVPFPPSVSHQRASPFLRSPHQLPIHSSPPASSRHSPQHLRSHHYSSPIHSGPPIPSPADPNAMSPRSSYGPRMAGGIDVLFGDSSSVRDTPRPDLPNYQGLGHDLPTERFVSESRTEHVRHDPKLSPLSARAFSLDDDRRQAMLFSRQPDAQEAPLPRERPRLRSLHSPFADDTMVNSNGLTPPPKETGFPLLDRYPIRVWEEQPTVRDTSRRLSPAHMLGILSSPVEGRLWGTDYNRLVGEDQPVQSPQHVSEDGVLPPARPYPTREELPPPRAPTREHVATELQTPINVPDPQPFLRSPVQPRSPIESGSQGLASLPLSSNSPAPTSPVPDLPIKNIETLSEPHPRQSDAQLNAGTIEPLPSSDTIIAEDSSLGKPDLVPGAMDVDDVLMANPLPHQSPEFDQPVLAQESKILAVPTDVSQFSMSPLPQPLSLPAKVEHDEPSEGPRISPPSSPEAAPCRSTELGNTPKEQPLVSEQAMMDVDEELLSLVEDRTVRNTPNTRIEPRPSTSEVPDSLSNAPSSEPNLKGLPAKIDIDEEKDRVSMPPPAARSKKSEKDKTSSAVGTATGSKKKKEGASKSIPKPKQPSKPRAKPAPKPKAKSNATEASSKSSIPKGVVNANTRSRSASVIPGAVDEVPPEKEVVESDREDDKFYCICKTRYDEDRMMIACDRCDEWFHTLCVNMPDLEIDLVDQFICPPCIQKNPHLRTTWKRRCLFGLQHESPSLPEACHKPARGAFSKYCSDDCGIKYMRSQIAQWEESGGTRDVLWDSVKSAARREGVVICVEASPPRAMDLDGHQQPKRLDSAAKRRAERDIARLNVRLEQVVQQRELMKRELDMVIWREEVVELASARAGMVDECGWDQRLCFGEEEWTDFGSEVLESYEEERVKVESEDAMPLDCAVHGEWWCTGKKKCERHAGWQKLRAAEVSFDKETKEGILLKLTTHEREIRKRIEDILYPQTGTLQASSNQINGCEKSHVSELEGKRSP